MYHQANLSFGTRLYILYEMVLTVTAVNMTWYRFHGT